MRLSEWQTAVCAAPERAVLQTRKKKREKRKTRCEKKRSTKRANGGSEMTRHRRFAARARLEQKRETHDSVPTDAPRRLERTEVDVGLLVCRFGGTPIAAAYAPSTSHALVVLFLERGRPVATLCPPHRPISLVPRAVKDRKTPRACACVCVCGMASRLASCVSVLRCRRVSATLFFPRSFSPSFSLFPRTSSDIPVTHSTRMQQGARAEEGPFLVVASCTRVASLFVPPSDTPFCLAFLRASVPLFFHVLFFSFFFFECGRKGPGKQETATMRANERSVLFPSRAVVYATLRFQSERDVLESPQTWWP